MTTVTYTFVERCEGGGHTVFDIAVNGGTARRVVYETDDIRMDLSAIPQERRELAQLLILNLHFAGMTRAQIIAELNLGPVTVTI